MRSGARACPGERRGRGEGRTERAHRLCLVAACQTPRGLRDVGYKSAWIIGAVCPARDTGVALVMTRLDTPAMNLFLAELGQAVAPDAQGIVLMDKAGWHTAGDLVVPDNLSLVFLPPYSPELNPIERLWLHLRDNRLSHCFSRPLARSSTPVVTLGIGCSAKPDAFDPCVPILGSNRSAINQAGIICEVWPLVSSPTST